MAETSESNDQPSGTPRYRWPWFVLGTILLAIILFILWMGPEIKRTRLIQEQNAPIPATSARGTNSNR